jgi:hypothetical protein
MDESKTRSERIRELIGIYGADFDRWPATEGLGRPLLDAELQKLRNEEDELDLLIAGAVVPALTASSPTALTTGMNTRVASTAEPTPVALVHVTSNDTTGNGVWPAAKPASRRVARSRMDEAR